MTGEVASESVGICSDMLASSVRQICPSALPQARNFNVLSTANIYSHHRSRHVQGCWFSCDKYFSTCFTKDAGTEKLGSGSKFHYHFWSLRQHSFSHSEVVKWGGRERQTQRGVHLPVVWLNFCQKLPENETIWGWGDPWIWQCRECLFCWDSSNWDISQNEFKWTVCVWKMHSFEHWILQFFVTGLSLHTTAIN